jgi:hypothetical protein
VEAASQLSEFMQWIIIGLGLLTTIIVSLNATEYMKNSANEIVKALPLVAIMLPALGTAAGAVNAYYAPHEKAIQATRTLTSLSQLHSQMALEVWTLGCASDDTVNKKLVEWTKRFQDIQSLATTNVNAKPSDGGANTSTSSSGGSKLQ